MAIEGELMRIIGWVMLEEKEIEGLIDLVGLNSKI